MNMYGLPGKSLFLQLVSFIRGCAHSNSSHFVNCASKEGICTENCKAVGQLFVRSRGEENMPGKSFLLLLVIFI